MGVCCLWHCSLRITHFLWQQIKVIPVLAKQKTLNSPIQSYPVSLSRTTTQNPGKPLRAWCAQPALGDNQWCQDPIQTDCALRGPWAEVSFVAPRSGLNSAVKYFGDVRQIAASLHLWVISVVCPCQWFWSRINLTQLGWPPWWTFLKKNPLICLLKPLKNLSYYHERQGLKHILLAAWAPPSSIFTRRCKELNTQCDGMRSLGHRGRQDGGSPVWVMGAGSTVNLRKCVCVCVCVLAAQSCPTFCDPIDYSARLLCP